MSTTVIADAAVHQLDLPLRTIYSTATGSIRSRRVVLIELRDTDGRTGWGEACRWPGSSADGLAAGVADAAQAVIGLPIRDALAHVGVVIRQDLGVASALCTAVLDLEAQAAGQSLAEALAQRFEPVVAPRPMVDVNALIDAGGIAAAVSQAVGAAELGIRVLKIKVGVAAPDADVARVVAVNEALGAVGGPPVRLRLDANGAWSVPDALVVLGGLHERGVEIEHIEDPVGSLAELAGLVDERGCAAGTGTPIAVDQPIADDPRPETIAAATAAAARRAEAGPRRRAAGCSRSRAKPIAGAPASWSPAPSTRRSGERWRSMSPLRCRARRSHAGCSPAICSRSTSGGPIRRARAACVPLDRPGLGIDVAVP